ncbi:hypothetical protein DAPPUDRAFT_314550 [Daphnia pulex]|uniref:Uncharacterized protein n=1 Tax=Daphnia pulex TaxID=6669 RepID=E9G6I9_DAPPU|nr:hypothetical protein DAPPUDRAFT_314550 [Daphnia pulex]|eukprot:EFX84984.1 hypothetical protein DAPPUDRAFT_314550 [Daphnia pulex]
MTWSGFCKILEEPSSFPKNLEDLPVYLPSSWDSFHLSIIQAEDNTNFRDYKEPKCNNMASKMRDREDTTPECEESAIPSTERMNRLLLEVKNRNFAGLIALVSEGEDVKSTGEFSMNEQLRFDNVPVLFAAWSALLVCFQWILEPENTDGSLFNEIDVSNLADNHLESVISNACAPDRLLGMYSCEISFEVFEIRKPVLLRDNDKAYSVLSPAVDILPPPPP